MNSWEVDVVLQHAALQNTLLGPFPSPDVSRKEDMRIWHICKPGQLRPTLVHRTVTDVSPDQESRGRGLLLKQEAQERAVLVSEGLSQARQL